jgi:hypothetical protein
MSPRNSKPWPYCFLLNARGPFHALDPRREGVPRRLPTLDPWLRMVTALVTRPRRGESVAKCGEKKLRP